MFVTYVPNSFHSSSMMHTVSEFMCVRASSTSIHLCGGGGVGGVVFLLCNLPTGCVSMATVAHAFAHVLCCGDPLSNPLFVHAL